MKIKVAGATGKPLDWAVGMALDPGRAKTLWRLMQHGNWNPSTDWSQGGPIIERVFIGTEQQGTGPKLWTARIRHANTTYTMRGPTPLIAAMRCFVASKLGDEVEVPEELT